MQEDLIPPYSGSLIELQIPTDYSFLKNIPDIECDLSAVNSFKMNQYIFTDSVPNQIYLFVGVNEQKKEKYIVVDANNNHDFSDDQLYTFSLPEKALTVEEKEKQCIGVAISLNADNTETANIGVDPFNILRFQYGLKQDPCLEVVIGFRDAMDVKAHLGDIPVGIGTFASYNLFNRKVHDKSDFSIQYEDESGELKSESFFKRDTLHIRDRLFKINRIEHPDIYIEEIGALADSSRVGSFMPEVYVKDIDTKDAVHLNELIKDKYVFIDFWGSWCGPCMKAIPQLQTMYDKVKDRDDVVVMGIAAERTDDMQKLKGVIEAKNIGWLNVWEDMKSRKLQSSVFSKLKIGIYPTYIILDKSGKIVYRGDASVKTEEITSFFLDTIGE